ncbi:MAG: glycoside hydrolase family 5 protein [Eubacterium sp.]|nr:glycoside hydrolase family 5 protein [Eubacterium sp.]
MKTIAAALCIAGAIFVFSSEAHAGTLYSDLGEAKESIEALHVEGTGLVNESGESVRLKGVSTHGLAWFPDYVNQDAFSTLRTDWRANVVRLAMYTQEYGGYCTVSSSEKKNLIKLIDKGVKAATLNGMYVIIDWHILSDGNPNTHKKAAKKFFRKMAKKYASYPNVIYEVCNEPNGTSWKSIRKYASSVVKVIRKYDSDAVVVVGTNTWSQDVDDVIGHELNYDNVMYSLHFYAGTHGDYLREKAQKALDAGVPLFITECGISDASGNGGVYKSAGNKWMKFINKNGLSFVAWNLSNKDESSALIKSSCSKTSGWKKKNLSPSGKWFRKKIRKQT